MLPKYVSETQLLSTLTPERQARFLLNIKKACYHGNYYDIRLHKQIYYPYIDRLNQTWELNDVIEALNKLPHVMNKQERINSY
jgi:hypothetical protein